MGPDVTWTLDGSRYALCAPKFRARMGVLGALVVLGACASGAPPIPEPRSIVIYSGARIRPTYEEMEVINEWVTREQQNIIEDPSFFVIAARSVDDTYPWDGMTLNSALDSVTVNVPLAGQDGLLVYRIYGHLHLMAQRGQREEWLPEALTAEGYELERAILDRVADAWILGRTVYDSNPFGPLDEIAYAKTGGYLDAFLFTARPNEFAASRTEWARANPDAVSEYLDWFVNTFNREPPGIRAN
jgi:hypothetical protein